MQEGENEDERRAPRRRRKQGSNYHCRTWEENYKALKAFKTKHGHCDVPSIYPEDPALGYWVSRTRSFEHDKNSEHELSIEQRKRLDKIGFVWDPLQLRNEKWWDEMYGRLKAYQQDHGDCRVPLKYEEDPQLGVWVNNQRRQKKDGKLPRHRERKLDKIDFTWVCKEGKCRLDPKLEQQWLEKYQQLGRFVRDHGHCLVSIKNKHHDKVLGGWVRTQRRQYANGKLRPDRQEMLDELGFVWYVDKKLTAVIQRGQRQQRR